MKGKRRDAVTRSMGYLRSTVLKSWKWLGRLAALERPAYDVADWVAVIVGVFSCVLLIVFFAFFQLMRFEWLFAEQSSPLAEGISLRGLDLGAAGIMVMALAAVTAVFLAVDAFSRGRGKPFSVNIAFIACVAVTLCIIVFLTCLLSDGVLIRYAGKKYAGDASFFRKADREEKIGWAGRKTLVGAYLCLLMVVLAFASAGSLLAESRELPSWIGGLIYRLKTRKRRGEGP